VPEAATDTSDNKDRGVVDETSVGQNDVNDPSIDQSVDPNDPDGASPHPGGCVDNVTFTGQVSIPEQRDPTSPNGGTPRFEPFDVDYDAGLLSVVAAVPAGDSEIAEVDLIVSRATVVATSFNSGTTRRAQNHFWLADGSVTLEVFFFNDDSTSPPPFSIRVGQKDSVCNLTSSSFRTFGPGRPNTDARYRPRQTALGTEYKVLETVCWAVVVEISRSGPHL